MIGRLINSNYFPKPNPFVLVIKTLSGCISHKYDARGHTYIHVLFVCLFVA